LNSRTSRGPKALIGAMLIILATGGFSQADETKKATSDGWTFQVSPYLWVAGVSGNVGVFKRVPPAPIDFSFSQLFDHINWPRVLMLAGEARHGRFGIFGDAMYMGLQVNGATPGPLFGSGTLNFNMFIGTFEGGYRVVDLPTFKLDGVVGVRVLNVGGGLSLSNGILPARSGSSSEAWADPVGGLRAIAPFGASGFYLQGYGDIGGGPNNGDLTWQLYGGLGYDFNNWLSGYAGYRYLDIQHQDGGFVFDVNMQGPLVGAVIRF
jgi:hypothetical protein